MWRWEKSDERKGGAWIFELKACKATLPPETLENDDESFKQLAAVFRAPQELPPEMTELLAAVIELANDKGALDLINAAKAKMLPIDWEQKATNLDIVRHVWLADAALMIEKHNKSRLVGATKFYYGGTKPPPANRRAFTPPTDAALELERQAVAKWCGDNQRHNGAA